LKKVHSDGNSEQNMVDMGTLKAAGELKRLTAQTATLTWALYQVTCNIAFIENVATRRKEIDEVECLFAKSPVA
jgi:hypothetical protein